MYKVLYTKTSRRALKAHSRKRARRIIAIMGRIAADPFARHPNLGAIRGEQDTFRYRLGDWRILYEIDRHSRRLIVLDILPRARAYG